MRLDSHVAVQIAARCAVLAGLALATDPKYLLLDEPFTGVDPIAVAELQDIVNHLRSFSSINDETPPVPPALATEGARVRAKRRAQAEYLANLVQTHIAENLVVVGDFNAYQLNDGYVDVMGTIKGTPALPTEVVAASSDLVNPDLTNLTESVAALQRYSYLFNGDSQAIDHVLVSAAMVSVAKPMKSSIA
jgi:predicted extracellular nuclease